MEIYDNPPGKIAGPGCRFILVIAVALLLPVCLHAQEDGWKYLKWGMTENEAADAFARNDSEQYTGKIKLLGPEFVFAFGPEDRDEIRNLSEMPSKLKVLYAENTAGDFILIGYMYDGKLFGRHIELSDDWFEDSEIRNDIVAQLRTAYPKGEVTDASKTLVSPAGKKVINYPAFNYSSKNISVFNTWNRLVLFDPKVLNLVIAEHRKLMSKKVILF